MVGSTDNQDSSKLCRHAYGQQPLSEAYKLNFDAALFLNLGKIGYGAIVRNEKGEVMTAMIASGPNVHTSEEAELLAY